MRFKKLFQDAWGCNISDYSFIISFNKEENKYFASWKNQTFMGKQASNWIEDGFDTFHKAEKACETVYKQLKNKN